jgi:hypothetical protein
MKMNEEYKAVIAQLEKRIHNLETNGIPGVRDFFATSVLSVLSRESTGEWRPDSIAKHAYIIADAMLEERKKSVS